MVRPVCGADEFWRKSHGGDNTGIRAKEKKVLRRRNTKMYAFVTRARVVALNSYYV